ncbi:MAG: peptidylprolyl isomerase [Muribaculaceae bacterium]|nr:peptidylprolyl isomerase [Muribaculaceae bacterium]
MKAKIITILVLAAMFFPYAGAQIQKEMTETNNDVKVLLHTSLGDITVLLYGDTPRHRDNFVARVNAGDYDGVLFHRVIDDFMVQTGDPMSKDAPKGKMLGSGDSGTPIEAEFLFPKHYHHRGALAAARQGDAVNPEKKSSGSQFYIVTGRKYSPAQLDQMEHQAVMRRKQDVFNELSKQHRDSIMSMRRNRDQAGLQALQEQLIKETEEMTKGDSVIYTPEMREDYMRIGGTPHLDGSYTVFGKVIDGMNVVDEIEKAETDANDRPLEDIKILSAKVIE